MLSRRALFLFLVPKRVPNGGPLGLFLELFPAQGQNENLAFRLSETPLFDVLGVPVILFLVIFFCCFFEGAPGDVCL